MFEFPSKDNIFVHMQHVAYCTSHACPPGPLLISIGWSLVGIVGTITIAFLLVLIAQLRSGRWY